MRDAMKHKELLLRREEAFGNALQPVEKKKKRQMMMEHLSFLCRHTQPPLPQVFSFFFLFFSFAYNLQTRLRVNNVRIDRDRDRRCKKSQEGIFQQQQQQQQHEMALQLLVDNKHLEIQATRTTRTLLFGAQRLVMGQT